MGFSFSFFIFAFTLFFLFLSFFLNILFLSNFYLLKIEMMKRKKLDFATVALYLKRLRWILFTCLQSWINISFLTNNLLINSWLHFVFFCYHLPIFPQYPTSFILIFLNPFITHFAPLTFFFFFYFSPFSICWLIIFHSKALIDRFIRKLNIFKWGVFTHPSHITSLILWLSVLTPFRWNIHTNFDSPLFCQLSFCWRLLLRCHFKNHLSIKAYLSLLTQITIFIK